MRALVAGATEFIGAALCERLLHEGDVLDAGRLTGAGEGVDVAYCLGHSMGRGATAGDFEQRELHAAEAFGRMCADEGVGRVIYLGGLGDEPGSKHLPAGRRRRRRSSATAHR